MKTQITGGCVCGEVRYECTARPLVMLNCHCRDCQQLGGGPYVAVVVVPIKAFKITKGALRHYATPSIRGGHNKRGFFPNCGSRLTGAENPEVGIIGLTASSLDDPGLFKPRMDIFVADAQSWDLMDPTLPKHQQHAPRG
jgi:hypothetical protein